MSEFALLEKLIDEFKAVPQLPPSPPTFMDISGYPHLENVSSNILRFFLNPEECHGLSDIMLRALFSALGRDTNNLSFNAVMVERETSTDRANRIDLVIETELYVIGIENKLFSDVGNDLKHYADYLVRRASSQGKEPILVLLTLQCVQYTASVPLVCFDCIRYVDWFQKIQALLGDYALDCDHRYLGYLLDFMNTLKGLGTGPAVNTTLLDFLARNENSIHQLARDIAAVRGQFRKQVDALSELVQPQESLGIRQWIYGGTADFPCPSLVHEIPSFENRQLAVDACLHPSGWRVLIHTRRKGSVDLREWLLRRGVATNGEIGRFLIYKEYPHSTPLGNIADSLVHLLGLLGTADAE